MTTQHENPDFTTQPLQPFADKCDCGNDATQVHEDSIGRLLYFCEDCVSMVEVAEGDE